MNKKIIPWQLLRKRSLYIPIISIFFIFQPCFLHASTDGLYAQEKMFTVKIENQTVKEVIDYIEKNSDFIFLYTQNSLGVLNKKVSIHAVNGDISILMDQLAEETGITYKIKDRQVILTEPGAKTANAPQQETTFELKGYVYDEQDQPIPGANVYVKGTTNGTVTDQDGLFSLRVKEDALLVVSFIGYQQKEIPVKKKRYLAVDLIPDNKVLEEVVVVGFGVQKKESLVGAVQSVKPAELKVTSSNLTTAFAGNVAGLITQQSSGEPGYDASNFYIRGISTFGYSTTPLIILDGVEITSAMLNNIPPESIESFSVLKDATATSLYGSRGANGVVIVTTRTGKTSEKMAVNIRFENTFSMPTAVQEVADGVTYMEMYNEAIKNGTNPGETYTPYYSQEKIDGTRAGLDPYVFPNNNWYEMLFKDFTMNQNLNVNVVGGGKKIDYFLNAGIFYENGIVKQPKEDVLDVGMRNKKYLFQSNVSAKITGTTKISLKMNTQLWYNHRPVESISNLFYYTMRCNPVRFPATLPAEEGDTFVRYGNNNSWDTGYTDTNPYALLSRGYQDRYYSYLTTAFTVDQDLKFITPGLTLKGLASFYNYTYSYTSRSMTPFYYKVDEDYTVDPDGKYNYTTSSIGDPGSTYLTSDTKPTGNRVWSLQGTLDYARTFGRHDVGATFVYHMKETVNNDTDKAEKKVLPFREQGLAGRFTYNFDHRYLFEATFGYNGSENFRKGQRYGFFPSAAIGWTVSREKFFEPLNKVVSNLKLRASYGLSGNDALSSRFPYVTEVNMISNTGWYVGQNFGQISGPIINVYGNQSATWEKAKKLNAGMDLSLWEQLDLSIDYFTEHRTGIFMRRRTIPSTAGLASNLPYANIGSVDNKGLDLTVAWNKVFNKDLTVQLKGTFTYAHNEIVAKDEPSNVEEYYSEIGQPVNSIRGLIAEGLFTSQEEIDKHAKQTFSSYTIGDIKYKDLNDDGLIDGNDITTIGNPSIPEILYGFGGTVKYKNWDLSLFFQGSGKVSLLMSNVHPFCDTQHFGYGITQYIVDDHWSENNNVATAAYPRLSAVAVENNRQASSYWLRNGSYVRLKNAEVGYSFSKFRFYLAGTNLLTFSPFDLWDPEKGGGNGLSYPLQRTVKIGVQFQY